jgi:hypothetical protein
VSRSRPGSVLGDKDGLAARRALSPRHAGLIFACRPAGLPDQLLCDPAANGGFLENGVCVLPDAVIGQSYQGHLPTSHQAGGTLSIIAGALPSGLSLPATFGPAGDVVTGNPAPPRRCPRFQLHCAGHG